MSYKIEKEVPIPEGKSTGKAEFLRTLDVGDSFECSPDDANSFRTTWQRMKPKTFLSKRQKNGKCRIWRSA